MPALSRSFSVEDYYALFRLKMRDGLVDKYLPQYRIQSIGTSLNNTIY